MTDDPAGRVVVAIYLPMELGKVGAILKVVSRQFPGAIIDQRLGNPWRVWAVDERVLPPEPIPADDTE